MNTSIRISIYQKSCIVEYTVSDRLEFLFSILCSLFFLLCGAPYYLRLDTQITCTTITRPIKLVITCIYLKARLRILLNKYSNILNINIILCICICLKARLRILLNKYSNILSINIILYGCIEHFMIMIKWEV